MKITNKKGLGWRGAGGASRVRIALLCRVLFFMCVTVFVRVDAVSIRNDTSENARVRFSYAGGVLTYIGRSRMLRPRSSDYFLTMRVWWGESGGFLIGTTSAGRRLRVQCGYFENAPRLVRAGIRGGTDGVEMVCNP